MWGAVAGTSFKSSADKLRGHFTLQHDMLGVMIAHGEFGASFAQSPKCARTGIYRGVWLSRGAHTPVPPNDQFQSIGDTIRLGPKGPTRKVDRIQGIHD